MHWTPYRVPTSALLVLALLVLALLASLLPGSLSAQAEEPSTEQVEDPNRLPRRPLETPPPSPERPARAFSPDDYQAFTDRWRLAPPPYEVNVQGSRWDPYNQNVLKGDYPILDQPIWGQDDLFFVLTAVSDSLLEGRALPTPSGVSADRPGSIGFFGQDGQFFAVQNLLLSGDLFRGRTAFEPIRQRFKVTLAANLNYLAVRENAVVRPDVREGTTRTDGKLAIQELFYEHKLADLSVHYDFLSARAGIQPFNSDFRGFVFSDTNLGVRLFGSLHSNRTQFNAAWFDRLEKDTNSGLNTFESRDQQVAVLNVYRQDFLVEGYTAQASYHYLRDEPAFHFDENGFLARPDPLGSFTPHEVEAHYFGLAGFGHFGRVNVDHALYYVRGEDSLNPIAGEDLVAGRADVDIEAWMAAVEISYDRDWMRPKLAYFYASGDGRPTDRKARGFDAIFDNPNFAGGGFSFWNRQGLGLAGTGVALTSRGSLLADVKSSKEEGQPNFVNPGVHLLSLGLDVEVTPKLKAIFTANALRFDRTESLELVLFQGEVRRELGYDLSAGVRYRPLLNQNVVVLGGIAVFLPGDGFVDIYEDRSALAAAFTNFTLTF